jgi:hypothetical protein
MLRLRMKFLAQDCKNNVGLDRADTKKVLQGRFPTSSDADIESVLDEVFP